jgi:LPS sulfotransferase NodH
VLKSPPHTARVRWLLEVFPDAKFVHISRHPFTLFPSTIRLWKALCDVQGLQPDLPEYPWLEEEVYSNLEKMYDAYDEDRHLVPPGNLCELKYEDLIADPKGELQRVYSELGLGDFKRMEPGLDRYLQDTSDYKTNRYALPPDVEARVRQRWAKYFEVCGYE